MRPKLLRYGFAAALLGVVLLFAATLLARRSAPVEPEPEIIATLEPGSDTFAAKGDAVGFCAINRRTGALEGRITAIADVDDPEKARYRVLSLDGSERESHVRPEAVHLDLCERATGLTPDGEPIRVGPGR